MFGLIKSPWVITALFSAFPPNGHLQWLQISMSLQLPFPLFLGGSTSLLYKQNNLFWIHREYGCLLMSFNSWLILHTSSTQGNTCFVVQCKATVVTPLRSAYLILSQLFVVQFAFTGALDYHRIVAYVGYFFQMSPRCASLALKHYLLKPVQRIPQYRLLLTGTVRLLYNLKKPVFVYSRKRVFGWLYPSAKHVSLTSVI